MGEAPPGLGPIGRAQEFADAAELLLENQSEGRPLTEVVSAPCFFCCAQALELVLKGCLGAVDAKRDPKNFGHDLIKLFDCLNTHDGFGEEIKIVEVRLADRWRRLLREHRDTHAERLRGIFPASPGTDTLKEFFREWGLQTDDEIEGHVARAANIHPFVEWFNARHKDRGGIDRYFSAGLDSRPAVPLYDRKIDISSRSAIWFTRELAAAFEERLRARRATEKSSLP